VGVCCRRFTIMRLSPGGEIGRRKGLKILFAARRVRVQVPPRAPSCLLPMTDPPFSAYDEIAAMYHALWADWYLPAALPALEKLFFSNVSAGSRILDVCCGSGHVTKELVRRGYRVTGIDSSAELIALARRDLPGVDLQMQDATVLDLESRYDAAISTFDSLNHILTVEDLGKVLVGVHRVLEPGGLFIFDMNLEEAYSADLRQWVVRVSEQEVTMVRGLYDYSAKKATTELIWFFRNGPGNCWRQRRSFVQERCYEKAEILHTLGGAGFRHIDVVEARDAGMKAELGFGRIFVSACA
jgi:SAM-dependent methyltransferase